MKQQRERERCQRRQDYIIVPTAAAAAAREIAFPPRDFNSRRSEKETRRERERAHQFSGRNRIGRAFDMTAAGAAENISRPLARVIFSTLRARAFSLHAYSIFWPRSCGFRLRCSAFLVLFLRGRRLYRGESSRGELYLMLRRGSRALCAWRMF